MGTKKSNLIKLKFSYFALAFAIIALILAISNPPLEVPDTKEKGVLNKVLDWINPPPIISKQDISQNTFLIRLSYVLGALALGLGIYSIKKKESLYVAGTAITFASISLLMHFFSSVALTLGGLLLIFLILGLLVEFFLKS